MTTERPRTSRASHEQFGYEGLETKPGHFPYAYDRTSRSTISLEDANALHCASEGCDATWQTPGGLARPGGRGQFRCAKHRKDFDHGALREDLRDAWGRVTAKAVIDERERIIELMAKHPPQQVYQHLIAQRPAKPDA